MKDYNLNVDILTNEIEIDFEDKIVDFCNEIYASFGIDNVGFVSIEFCNSEQIQEINNTYRNKDSDTDVLSFEYYDKLYENVSEHEGQILNIGDILISTEYAKKQAIDLGNTFEDEVLFLICHAMLHLLGFDHIESDDEKQMLAMQKKLFGDYHERINK